MVNLKVKRGDETKELQVELAGEIDPYIRPELGMQISEQEVVAVVPDSPADGNVEAGDKVISVGGVEVEGFDEIR